MKDVKLNNETYNNTKTEIRTHKLSFMKTITNLVIFITIFLPSSLMAQWTFLGLGKENCRKIEVVEIYAGTSNGFFKKNLNDNDTIWTSLGLEGKEITDFVIFTTDTILVSTNTYSMGGEVSLFITYNNGINWSNYQNGFGGNSGYSLCSSLELNPSASDTIIARAGACVAKSTDKGITWQEVYMSWAYGGTQYHFIFDIDPNNPGTLWAGGVSGFLFPYLIKSIDYGNSWQFIEVDGGGDNTCYSLINHPNNFNKILVGLSDRIIISLDGGESWSIVYNPSVYTAIFDMEISPNNNELVYATGRKHEAILYDLFFLKSYDFGITWETVNYPSNNISYWTWDLKIINEDSKDELFFATNHGIYRYSNSLISVPEIENQNENSWTLYPNPMSDKTTLSFNNLRTENHIFTLQDTQGRCVRTISNITTNQVVINKDKLPKGQYGFQLRNNREVYATGKLIIN